MLKLSYSETGLYMEPVATTPELLIAGRAVLAMRSGISLHVEPGCASFLFPADITELEELGTVLQQEWKSSITVTPVDDEFVEVGLSGTWVAETREAQEGMFLVVMSRHTEAFIYRLWQTSEVQVSSLV